MNREYNSRVSSKNSERLLKNLQNTTGDYFFAAPCRYYKSITLAFCDVSKLPYVLLEIWPLAATSISFSWCPDTARFDQGNFLQW